MNQRFLVSFLSILLISSIGLSYGFFSINSFQEDTNEIFVGVDVAIGNIDYIKELVDEVSPYTNLFVIGSTGISYNETLLNETCKYLYEHDLHFIIYTHSRTRFEPIKKIEETYPNHFLGVYFDDEQGGKQLDIFEFRWVNEAENSSAAANQFVNGLSWWINGRNIRNETQYHDIPPSDFQLFTSDYTYYWYDYRAGYDVVFAEFGWNYSRQLNVALCRGAASLQNKEWGAIIAWTYNDWPYIETGKELYDDMKLAYDNGAKYILIFDTDENYTQGIVKEEHFEALRKFWEYTKNNQRPHNALSNRVAYVLPEGYGYGFRGPNDKIWGLWEADSLSLEISYHLGYFLNEYKTNLDVIYDDDIATYNCYSKYIFWNGTIYNP